MWEPLPVEVRKRLQRDNALLSSEHEYADWEHYIEAIEQYRELLDDYDGQGAIAPTSEVIDSAITLARDLVEADLAVPTYCVPSPRGGVNLFWDFEDERNLSVEVESPSHAEVILVDDDEGEHRVCTLNRIVEEVVG